MTKKSNEQRQYELIQQYLYKSGGKAKQVYLRKVESPRLVDDFDFRKDYMSYHMQTYEVPALEITIAVEDMAKLLERQEDMEHLERIYGPHVMEDVHKARLLLQKEREEEYVRRGNPALQKAWSNYQLLLKIAGG